MPSASSAETRGGLHYVVGRRVDPKLTERKSFNFIIQFFFSAPDFYRVEFLELFHMCGRCLSP